MGAAAAPGEQSTFQLTVHADPILTVKSGFFQKSIARAGWKEGVVTLGMANNGVGHCHFALGADELTG